MMFPNNKLYRIKQIIEEWESTYNSNRQYEVKLGRPRIGHSRMTHEYLITKEEPPNCQHCLRHQLTVKHYLVGCQRWAAKRRNLNLPGNMKEILVKDCEVPELMELLKKAEVFDKI